MRIPLYAMAVWLLVSVAALRVGAERVVVWQEDFEGLAPGWIEDTGICKGLGTHRENVHFVGVTDEHAASGTHSLKIDLTLECYTWCNIHPQYSRSLRSDECRDILIQENHGHKHDAAGVVSALVGREGADIHVLRDDGANLRDMAWGRDGIEFCQGHQCWRGRSAWAITSTYGEPRTEERLVEGLPAAHAGHAGRNTPGGIRRDLSPDQPEPHYFHFAADIAGGRLITDYQDPADAESFHWLLFVADLPEPGQGELQNMTYLLDTGSRLAKSTHAHPFLSPDGTMGFFNSDESGLLQAYMIRGLDTV